MRRGGGAAPGMRWRGGKSGTARHDPPILDQPGADCATAGNRDGRYVARHAGAARLAGLATVDRVVAEHARGALGRMAVLPAWLDVDHQPLDEHVYPDRDGHRRRLLVQPGCDSLPANVPRIISRYERYSTGLLRSCSRNRHTCTAGAGAGTERAQPHWIGYSRAA